MVKIAGKSIKKFENLCVISFFSYLCASKVLNLITKIKDKSMANLRFLKKEIDYRLEELVFDCDMTIYFRPDKEQEIFAIMQEGVELRNELYHKANNPVEPKNASLVRKYYAAFRNEMVEGYGKLFEKLSALHD